ncbi:MAG: hypothetical protein HHJ12_19020 [Glaciimonas sp.]|nr:hypothetical protein [Glaciimonas sp.]
MLKVDGQTLAVNFRSVCEKIKLIQDEDSAPVIICYCGLDGNNKTIDQWLSALKKDGPDLLADAQAAAYSVTISRRDAMWPLAQSDVEEVIPGLFVQANNLLYSNQLGLIIVGFYLLSRHSSSERICLETLLP